MTTLGHFDICNGSSEQLWLTFWVIRWFSWKFMKSNQFQNEINSKIRHSSKFDHISTQKLSNFSKTPNIIDLSHKMHTLRDTCNRKACCIIRNTCRIILNAFRIIRYAYSIRLRSSMQLVPTWKFRNACTFPKYTLKKSEIHFSYEI